MANTRYVEFVAELLRLTQDQTIKWFVPEPGVLSVASNFGVVGRHVLGNSVYHASHLGKNLSLVSGSRGLDDPVLTGNIVSNSIGIIRTTNEPPIALSIVNEDWNVVFTFPDNVAGLRELHRAVQHQVSGVEEYIDSVLAGRYK